MTDLRARVLPHLPPGRLLLAFSGGLDSTALLHILANHADIFAAHVHHGLREDADHDEAFCRTTCDRLGVGFESVRIHLGDNASGSTQHRARIARYAALARIAREQGAAHVVTAHHQDDTLETAALMWTRGAGARGLSAMTRHIAPYPLELPGLHISRPMLGISRGELQTWVHEQNITWVEDPSNARDTYTRNHLRHHVMDPWLQASGAREGALASLNHLRADTDVLDEIAHTRIKTHTLWCTPDMVRMHLSARDTPAPILARMWNVIARQLPTRPTWGGSHREALTTLLHTSNARDALHLPGARACVSRGALLIEATRARGARDLDTRVAAPITLSSPGTTPWFEGHLSIGEGDIRISREDVARGLELRGPRPGDRTRRGRKLGELLRNLGVHPTQRWRWPCVGRVDDGALVWAVGDQDPGADVPMGWTWGKARQDCPVPPGEK